MSIRICTVLSLVIFGASLGWLLTQPNWEPLIVCLGSLGTASALIFEESRKNVGVQWFRTRKRYLERILREVQAAERQILMCVHTLGPPNTNRSVEELHRLLHAKHSEGVDVRIVGPTGVGCTQASYELMSADIKVRHLPTLENRDISFSVFDSVRAVVPTRSGTQEETVEGFTVHSAKLAKLLKDDFFSMWWSHDAMSYESFIRHMVMSAGHDTHSTTLPVMSEKLGVPLREIERILPAYGCDEPRRHFFIIGMPASGKTTVAACIQRYLQASGVQPKNVYQFNDYATLYERSLEDHQCFEPGQRGGFRVKDFTVLDTVLEQANTQLRLAQQSHLTFIVEFSRPSYLDAFQVFDRQVMRGSVIVYVRCSVGTCRHRNETRTEVNVNHTTGYVPSDILDDYYKSDDFSDLGVLAKLFGAEIIEIDTDIITLNELDAEVSRQLEAVDSRSNRIFIA